MREVSEVREVLRRRLMKNMAAWAAVPGDFKPVSFALQPPTEKEALAHQQAAKAWVGSWREVSERLRGASCEHTGIDWETRSWSRIGRQTVPVRCELTSAEAVADFVAGEAARRFRRLQARAVRVREELGAAVEVGKAIRAQGQRLADLDGAEFERTLEVVTWLAAHPVGQLRPRQIPIRGVDSKWFSAHRTLVTALLAAIGRADAVSVLDAEPRLRVRFLDPNVAHLGGVQDVTAPVGELASMGIVPETVFVFENLETVLSMPHWPGAVAIHGGGYGVDGVAALPWLEGSRVLYWGDVDSHGFAILSRFRSHVPHAASVLMDQATLLAHRDLWVTEPKPNTAEFAMLTDLERQTLGRVRAEGNVRLEQERIPWPFALRALQEAAGTSDGAE